MAHLRVLVVGASVAGPMAAYWLAKAGAHVTIVERFPELRTGGQNVDIRTCGVTVMRKIPGLEASVRARAAPLEGLQFVSHQGRPYLTVKATGTPEQQSLISEYEIFRDDLAQILYHLTKTHPRVRYVFGTQLSVLRHEKDHVHVEFTGDKLPPSSYDLVVAADGATSRTRAMGFDCKVRDHTHPLNSWAAYCTISPDLLRGSKMAQFSTSTPGRAMVLGPDHGSQSNRVVLMGSYASSAATSEMTRLREAIKQGDGAMKKFLLHHFQGHGRDDILAAVVDSDNLYASEALQVKMPLLYHDRVVLIGDAGYAAGPVGTGTTMAITGAYLLAGEINKHPQDIATALQNYAEKMNPIIKDMQRVPPGFPGILTPQSPWALSARNWVLRGVAALMAVSEITPIAMIMSWLAGLFSSSLGKDKYNIPDYDWRE